MTQIPCICPARKSKPFVGCRVNFPDKEALININFALEGDYIPFITVKEIAFRSSQAILFP